jgi:2-methylisocitrate lyase-like PEP mutase family enzyme
MKGKQVIPLEEQLKQALGLNEAITRGMAFKQAGADAVFIEAPETREEMLEIARCVPGPLVANMLERGVTPLMGPQELRDLGFDLVVWPLAPLYSVAKSPMRFIQLFVEKEQRWRFWTIDAL